MRTAIAVALSLHGLAHLVGFLAPLGLTPRGATNPSSTATIIGGRVLGVHTARWLGLLWVGGAAAFLYAAAVLIADSPNVATPVLLATLASLLLTAVWWPVARTGFFINVGILTALLAVGAVQFRHDMRVAWQGVGEATGVVRTSLGEVQYASRGSGDPVLVIHGTGGGFDQSLYASGALVQSGYRLIAPSRFGYLGTPMRADASPALEARLFAELLDSLGVRRVSVISYSAGTAPAVQFALKYPERVSALALVVPAAGGMVEVTHPNPPPKFMMDIALKYDLPMWLTWKLAPSLVYRVMAVPPALVPTLSREDRAHLDRGATTMFPVSARYQGTTYDAATQSGSEPLYPLEQVRAPTLLVSAEDDMYETLANARRIAERIPGSRVLAFPTGGHMLAGRAGEAWPAISAFFATAKHRVP